MTVASIARAQVVRDDMYVTNGSVLAATIYENVLYIGGYFTRVGPAMGCGIPFDAITGAPVGGFPKVIGVVYAAASDGAGGWFIGGQFSSVGDHARANLAHIRGDNSVSDWNPGTIGTVQEIAVADGIVYIGGFFNTVGGEPRTRLAAVNGVTGMVTSWNPGANGRVDDLALHGGTLYIAGTFSMVAGQSRACLAAFDVGTGEITDWNPGTNDEVVDLDVNDGVVYVCGWFTSAGGEARNYIAALDAATGNATPWDPNPDDFVSAIAVNEATVFASGDFTNIGGNAQNRLAALDRDTGSALPWNPNADARGTALFASGDLLYIAGYFTNIGGQDRNCLAALDIDTGLATPWNPDVNNTVLALAEDSGVVYAGGHFTSAGGVTRNRIAALDLTTGSVTPWNPNANGRVTCLAAVGNTVYAGGDFYSIGGQLRGRIAALDATTSNATPWLPNWCCGDVSALAVSHSTVYVAGAGSVQALDSVAGTRLWIAYTHQVFTLVLGDDRVYAGGYFPTMGGEPHDCLAAIDRATGAVVSSWNPGDVAGVDDFVLTLALDANRTLFVGGPFSSVGGQPRLGIAAVDAQTGVLTPWTADTDGGGVEALTLSANTLYLGGLFHSIDAQPRRYLAAIDLATDEVTPLSLNFEDWVETVAVGSGYLCAGGVFRGVEGLPQSYVAVVAPVPVGTEHDLPWNADVLATPAVGDRDRIEIRYALGSPAPFLRLGIYDVHGRRVRSFGALSPHRGTNAVLWNGRTDAGARIARGVYLVLLEAGARTVSRKLVLLDD